MKVLMITGDKRFGPGHPRYELQKSTVEQLDVFVWPRKDSLIRIFNVARRGHYDVVTAQDPFWRGHLAHHLVQLFGGKLNIQVHADLSAESWWRRMFAQLQLRNANSVRVVSEKIKQQVESLDVTAPICVVPVYIDVSRFKTIVREHHTQKTILWVGRFEIEKDPLFALHVFKDVLDAGIDAKLVMLGTGSLEPLIKKAAGEIGAGRAGDPQPKVDFPGWQDPALYLGAADVVISTSLHESWGASMVEALAAGVPVVAPDVGIAREAGATIAPRAELSKKVVEVLKTNATGQLRLQLPSAGEWAEAWKLSL